ncbi:MAG: hypothetical protein AAF787_16195 [Chloroflexota bacterium]
MVDQTVRVSCGALCRIKDPATGKYLLGINPNRSSKGIQVLMPIGGAIRYTMEPPIPFTPETPGSKDLRLMIKETMLPAFQNWFEARIERELNPFRELREELVDEYNVLPALYPQDVTMRYVSLDIARRFTDRTGVTGMLTHSFQEIFDVTFTSKDLWHRLKNIPVGSSLCWTTAEQIRAHHYTDNVTIQADVLQLN